LWGGHPARPEYGTGADTHPTRKFGMFFIYQSLNWLKFVIISYSVQSWRFKLIEVKKGKNSKPKFTRNILNVLFLLSLFSLPKLAKYSDYVIADFCKLPVEIINLSSKQWC
jgi:hypothetical protein